MNCLNSFSIKNKAGIRTKFCFKSKVGSNTRALAVASLKLKRVLVAKKLVSKLGPIELLRVKKPLKDLELLQEF